MKMSDLDAHPVFSKNFTVQTNAIAEASNEALDSIFMRQTGLIFYGMSRVGKTCCIKAIKSKLGNFMPRAYITQIEVAKKRRELHEQYY
jgi:DNA replication protein DnaC